MCENCGKESNRSFYDKVSRKLVCESCKIKAIEMGIRFAFDFEEWSETHSEGVKVMEKKEIEAVRKIFETQLANGNKFITLNASMFQELLEQAEKYEKSKLT